MIYIDSDWLYGGIENWLSPVYYSLSLSLSLSLSTFFVKDNRPYALEALKRGIVRFSDSSSSVRLFVSQFLKQAHCFCFSLYLSFFCLFQVSLCHSFLRNCVS